MSQALDDIIADFELLDDWEDRYRYIIDLGRSLAPLPDLARTEGNKVQGCVSQVWLQTSAGEGPDPQVFFLGDCGRPYRQRPCRHHPGALFRQARQRNHRDRRGRLDETARP